MWSDPTCQRSRVGGPASRRRAASESTFNEFPSESGLNRGGFMRHLRILDTNRLIAHWQRSRKGPLSSYSREDASRWAEALIKLDSTAAVLTPVILEFLCRARRPRTGSVPCFLGEVCGESSRLLDDVRQLPRATSRRKTRPMPSPRVTRLRLFHVPTFPGENGPGRRRAPARSTGIRSSTSLEKSGYNGYLTIEAFGSSAAGPGRRDPGLAESQIS